MKPMTVREVRQLLNGQLIQGCDDFLLESAGYQLSRMNKEKHLNVLIFLRKKRPIDWSMLTDFKACAIVTDQMFDELQHLEGRTIILVSDIEKAYWGFVDYYRNLFSIPVAAVTGTSGKTTVKEIIKHILAFDYNVKATVSSFNETHRSLQYLMEMDDDIEAAIFETAVGKPGDVTEHCRYFKPSIGIITNIGVYHLDLCKTMEAYIEAKAGMVTGIDPNGILILNADDDNIKKIDLSSFKGKVVYFGLQEGADFQACDVRYTEEGMMFTVTFQNIKHSVFIRGYGEHQVYNALAALACVHEMGVSIRKAAERLASYKSLKKHLEVGSGINGSIFIDDSWNSNPLSIKAAFHVLNNMDKTKRKIAVVTDLIRLADLDSSVYKEIGDVAVESGIDALVTIGAAIEEAAKQAKVNGFKGDIYTFKSCQGVYELLEAITDENSILLFKGRKSQKSNRELIDKLKGQQT